MYFFYLILEEKNKVLRLRLPWSNYPIGVQNLYFTEAIHTLRDIIYHIIFTGIIVDIIVSKTNKKNPQKSVQI